jgi:hypothetical protein
MDRVSNTIFQGAPRFPITLYGEIVKLNSIKQWRQNLNIYTLVEAEGTRPWKIIGGKQEDVIGSARTLEEGLELARMLNDPERMED